MEYYGLSTSVLTMYLGLFLFDQKIRSESRIGIATTLIIVFVNIAWLLVSVYLLFNAFFKRIFRLLFKSSSGRSRNLDDDESSPPVQLTSRVDLIEGESEMKVTDEIDNRTHHTSMEAGGEGIVAVFENPLLHHRINTNEEIEVE